MKGNIEHRTSNAEHPNGGLADSYPPRLGFLNPSRQELADSAFRAPGAETPNLELAALAQRIAACAAQFEAGARYLTSALFQAHIAEALRDAVIRAQSPWVNRDGAALHCCCSVGEIDRAKKVGTIKVHLLGETPRFLKSELDEAILSGKWRRAALPEFNAETRRRRESE